MSTAGRPSYVAAIGRATNSTIQTRGVCGKDQRGHTKLKFRQIGQATVAEIKQRDLKQELDRKEHKNILENDKSTAWQAKDESSSNKPAALLLKDVAPAEINAESLKKYDDSDIEQDEGSNDGFDSSSEEDDDDDDEDDEDELQAELERIREEKAVAAAKRAQEERDLEEKLKRDSALRSNPLVMGEDSSAKMKRRWNDDVVFRNQARDEPETKKRFINDTIRSDFHRSFLKKFIQ